MRFSKRLAGAAASLTIVAIVGVAAPAAQAAPASQHAQDTASEQLAIPAIFATTSDTSGASSSTGHRADSVAATPSTPAGLAPADLRQAYDLQSTTSGSGQTVAVVTAYNDSTLASDLAAYRTQYSVPACTTTNGCLSVVSQTGTSSLPGTNAGWDANVAVSTDMISAICPNCHILIIEASSNAIADLGVAENEAVTLGAKFIDNDWLTPEAAGETSYDSYFNHPGVAITAPADNSGYGTSYPAASPSVIAVGGTTLTADSSSPRGFDETAWTNSGSGCSPYEAKPSWQTDTGCADRTLNDLAADAGTPVAYDDTFTVGGWGTADGTVVASAIVAAAYALAGTPGATDSPAEYPYEHPGGSYTTPGNAYISTDGLYNITSGSDGTCSVSYLCTAGAGYNGPTGLGSLATALSLTSGGSSARSDTVYNGVFGMCMDDASASAANGNKVQAWSCTGTGNQRWALNSDGTISWNGNNACLDVLNAGTTAGNLIVIRNPCSATDGGDLWIPLADGTVYNPHSGMCLTNPGSTTSGTQLTIAACGTAPDQKWILPVDRPAATAAITSKITAAKLCIDDRNDATSNGNAIQIYSCLGNANQTWLVEADDSIRFTSTAYCLSVDSDGTANGTNVVLWACNGDPDQHWIERSDGTLQNLGNTACLEDPAASTTNGTQLTIHACDTNTQQQWNVP